MKYNMKEIRAGALVRRPVRRFLLREGIQFSEEKGWLDSVFYLNCEDEKYQWVKRSLKQWQEKVDKPFPNETL